MQILTSAVEETPITSVREHPENPNVGDVGAIGSSISTTGWYGAIVANRRTGYVLAGNHRYRVAKSQGATTIPVAWVEVDDHEERRILLADNRIAQLNNMRSDKLLALLTGIPDLIGTGYTGEDLSALIATHETTEILDDPTALRQIVLVYERAQYVEVLEALEQLVATRPEVTFSEVVAEQIARACADSGRGHAAGAAGGAATDQP